MKHEVQKILIDKLQLNEKKDSFDLDLKGRINDFQICLDILNALQVGQRNTFRKEICKKEGEKKDG